MFKLLLHHIAIEKAIDVLFQKIIRNFPNTPERYNKVFVQNTNDLDGDNMLMVLYNVELNDSNNDLYAVCFEYFKYCNNEYDWMHEQNMSSAIKQPSDTEWYEIPKEFIIKKS
jgi:hypothetical protein